MPTRTQLDAAGVVEVLRAATQTMQDHRLALDRLGSDEEWEPVDDAESDGRSSSEQAGSALAETLRVATEAVEGSTSLAQLAVALAAVRPRSDAGPAAREFSDVLAGLAEAMRNADHLDGARVAIGLELAAERLAAADDGSHAGCLPAVLAVAADAALGAVDDGATLPDVLIAAAEEGLVELESGPVNNPDLVRRGVVDPAAAGLLLVLDVFTCVVTDEPLPAPPAEPPTAPAAGAHRYRVACRIEPHEGSGLEDANWLESTWHQLGELVEFSGSGASWRGELLTVLPGAAVEAVFEVGRPRDLHLGLADPAGSAP